MSVTLLGIPFESLSREEIMARVRLFLYAPSPQPSPSRGEGGVEPRPHMIATVNPEMLVAAERDPELKEILQKTDLNVADGVGVLFAANLPLTLTLSFKGRGDRTKRRIQRFPGVDLMIEICRICAEEGRSVYLLGGRADTAEKTAARLKEKFPGLKVVGAEQGPQIDESRIMNHELRENSALVLPHPSPSPSKERETIEQIVSTKPDVLFVAFGHGKQEKWIHNNFFCSVAPSPQPSPSGGEGVVFPRICIGVGGAFDMISGTLPRAPWILRKIGVEWIWRLLIEPRRVFRIINAVLVFPSLLFFERLRITNKES